MNQLNDAQIETLIRQSFENNFKRLQAEGGHSLAPNVKELALQQVLIYWRKLRHIAEKVTDTEVRLNFPNQRSPKQRQFGIEGIVDIVREGDHTTLYDIKTHEASIVREKLDEYERQLNVYAYIWQQLQGQRLDATAVIAAAFPDPVRQALRDGDEAGLERELARWDPLVEIPFDSGHVEETIRDFGETVDHIEDGHFAAASVDRLRDTMPGSRVRFATYICRNCDARFACESYREYVHREGRSRDRDFRLYYGDDLTGDERDDWLTAALDAAPSAGDLAEIA